jgi:hypothetical protein
MEFSGGLATEIAIFFEGFVDDAFGFGGSLGIMSNSVAPDNCCEQGLSLPISV